MKPKFTILLTSLVVCISGALCISAYPQTSGLTPVQLMAMIAGGAFPENLSQDLESRGISFEPDDNFISLANAAGATPTVISALRNSERQLGRNEEAAKLEQRAQSLQSSQSAQMPMPPPSPR